MTKKYLIMLRFCLYELVIKYNAFYTFMVQFNCRILDIAYMQALVVKSLHGIFCSSQIAQR